MKLRSFEFSKDLRKDTGFVDFINDLTNLINNARYQMRIITSVPTWTGEDGEFLLYISGTVRRLYWYDPTNSTWQFIEWNNSGLGQATIVGTVQLTGQTGDIATTTIITPAAAGLYRISVYMICTTAGTGTLSCTVDWSDSVGAKTLKPTADVDLASTANGATGNAFISSVTSVAITYATAIAGKAGSPQYSLFIVVERLV